MDDTYPELAAEINSGTGHIVVRVENYGQGSSREHAQDDVLRIDGLRDPLRAVSPLVAHDQPQEVDIALCHRLSQRQVDAVHACGAIPLLAEEPVGFASPPTPAITLDVLCQVVST